MSMRHRSLDQMGNPFPNIIFWGAVIVAGLVALVVMSMSLGLGYFLAGVDSNEVGVRLVRNEPVEVVGPGVYTDWGPQNFLQYKDLEAIHVGNLAFVVADDEVITKDRQRVGITVTGNVRRVSDPETILANWGRLRSLYGDDGLIVAPGTGVLARIGGQAMKVCVGDSTFDDAVVGSGRDTLGVCIARELGEQASGYALVVSDVVIPNVTIAPDVQKRLDEITQARLATQLADQRARQVAAEAEQEVQRRQGEIRVVQGQVQERARQDARTAELQVTALQAQAKQIDAEASNRLLQAQKNKEIAEAERLVKETQARADVAAELAKAEMYQRNPTYANLEATKAAATAYRSTDKVIMVPDGTNPIVFLGGTGQVLTPTGSGR